MTKTNNKEYLTCVTCAESKEKNSNFYNTANKLYEKIGKLPICKKCLKSMINYDNMESVYSVFQQFDIMFHIEYWEKAEESKMDTFGKYMTMANSLPQFESMGWKNSIFTTSNIALQNENEVTNFSKENKDTTLNTRDRDDVIRMLGYDPFEYENPIDKKHLYNRLIDFLDESTLEDGFKLQASIEIVKGFNQVDKINQAITNITNDLDKLSTSNSGIKALIDSKKNILASLIKLAEENGISVKHNNQKSKGAGTLSGNN